MPGWRGQIADEIAALERDRVIERIWRRDPGVWAVPSPGAAGAREATGWLDLPGQVSEQTSEAREFADEVRAEGLTDVVLLGMGGSSLGPLALERIFGSAPGYLSLHVLDSTVPGQIRSIRDRVDFANTLILVSSKSGTTIEPLTLADYFRSAIGDAGVSDPDGRFVAITDPGTPLQKLAVERGYRRVFNAPPDVGGRFSVLSNFGIVPAALAGLDIGRLGNAAVAMATACGPDRPATHNPGATLGAALGTLAANGKDKVTILTSPSIDAFGLWVEQLLAESTGKNGRGLIPVAEEPFSKASAYGPDRHFVYVRLDGDANDGTDDLADELEKVGHPVTRLELADRYDIGAEFFRWEFAVSVAATVINVYPFDQPDVEAGKVFTRRLLSPPGAGGRGPASLPVPTDLNTLIDTVLRAKNGDYIAICGYLPESEDVSAAVARLRAAISNRTGVATTFGYGPRYLHSTGQLHKGGPESVIGLALVAGNEEPLAATGVGETPEPGYGFESLFLAQVKGDVEAFRSVGRRHVVAALHNPYPDSIREIATLIDPTSQ